VNRERNSDWLARTKILRDRRRSRNPINPGALFAAPLWSVRDVVRLARPKRQQVLR
jgi:hypothetical protein